ncbi:MAG: hypothetical protein OEM02_05530 [Desulfobulbaceae bacterium]|nr:hypothetical protein [Desulfobulbaceae bacterium]
MAMKNFNKLLEQSTILYRKYLSELTKTKNMIGELNNTEVVEHTEQLSVLLEEIKLIDESVNQKMLAQTLTADQLERHKERLELMGEINERNKQLTSQVQGIIAVQKTEIEKIRSGRESMNGYASQLKSTGRRINSNA